MIHATYTASPPPTVAYELKTCELCTRNFTREVGTQIKYCRPCSSKQLKTEKPISITQGRKPKSPERKSKTIRARAVLQKIDPARELRAAWIKSTAEKPTPEDELRNAWHLQ